MKRELIYSAEPQLKYPRKLFRRMLNDLRASRELAWRLFIRNIAARYRQTFLGYIWALLPPIFTTVIFVFLNTQNILNIQTTVIPYPVYVMSGTLLWQAFVDALNSPLRLITSSRSMLVKINFPREALMLAGIGEVLFNFAIRFSLLIFILLWFKMPIPPTFFFCAPFGILSLIMFGLMIGMLLMPLGVLYQDISQGLGLITAAWFFFTPVIYPPPESWPASLLATLNPVSPLLVTTREWITSGASPQLAVFMVISVFTCCALCVGWILYHLAMPHLIARIGS